jgi:aryl-alcohol dehydrogenase-like predicted oxidoreductase
LIYRTLGRTGLRVSVVGFGASPLGNEFGASDPAESCRAVSAAIDAGINYFDVAPYYGRTLAETRLGECLAGRRHEVVLATKAGRYDKALPEGFDFSAERIARSIDESLRRLRTDYIDVYQLHDIEFAHRAQILGETLPAMQRLKEAGKIRWIGITGYPPRAARRGGRQRDRGHGALLLPLQSAGSWPGAGISAPGAVARPGAHQRLAAAHAGAHPPGRPRLAPGAGARGGRGAAGGRLLC